ncbi:hypothetical protein F4779DRAFT_640980 [Xylariaceae sp. FL0662B]|nr:hypothetical protein F4779DRAFT_640980 [Xylariaceae sp. FL0662B]
MLFLKTQNKRPRRGFRERLNRIRRVFRGISGGANTDSTPKTQVNPTHAGNLDTSSAISPSSNQTHDAPMESIITQDNATQARHDQSSLLTVVHRHSPRQDDSVDYPTLGVDIGVVTVSSDLWSAAYREAVYSLGKDINVAILKGENAAQLFRQLEEIDKEATQESIFLRGVRRLHSIQVPLENFKLASHPASPLTAIESATATVFGVVRSVTAVS